MIHLDAAHGCSASSRNDDANILDLLAIDLQGIHKACTRNDGCAVLVVVHHGDVAVLLQAFFDIETLGCLDVLKVDATERWGDALHGLAELHGIGFIDLDVEDVNAAIDLEEEALALHDGFASQGSDVAKAKHCGAVGYYGYEIAAVGVTECIIGILLDLKARIGHAG